MTRHAFIFTPGEWLGEGTITFSASPVELKFFTHWDVRTESQSQIQGVQKVEVHEGGDPVINTYTFSTRDAATFGVMLKNEMVGTATGKGVVDDKRLAWQFNGLPGFEGYEVYELQPTGEYLMKAEYLAEPDYRTHIQGRIWKKGQRK